MKYGALAGWGIVIYAIMYLTWSIFVQYGFNIGILPRVISLLTLIAITTIAARSLRALSWKDILPYSAFWLLEIIALDILLSVPYTGWALFSDWNIWVGYALVVFVPLLAPLARRHTQVPPDSRI